MQKYIFSPVAETMAKYGKAQADLTNITDNVLTKYGTVESIEIPFNSIEGMEGTNIIAIPHTEGAGLRIAELERELAETKNIAKDMDIELNHYAPLINFVKAMNAESLARIEALTKRAESAEMTASELSEFAELIEVAKKLKG